MPGDEPAGHAVGDVRPLTAAAALALLELRGVTAGWAALLHRIARLRRKGRAIASY